MIFKSEGFQIKLICTMFQHFSSLPGMVGMLCFLFSWSPDRKSTRLNSSHVRSSYAVFCLKKKKSIAAGVRRLVAVTGPTAVELSQRAAGALRQAAALLRAGAFEVVTTIEAWQRRVAGVAR